MDGGKMLLHKDWQCVFFLKPMLGDSLFAMIVIYHLKQAGYKLTVLSDILYLLKGWFPNINILPVPNDSTRLIEQLNNFDQVIAFHTDHLPKEVYLFAKRPPHCTRTI
jgi:hypothetical protein